jgi:hypothetical protein
VRSAKGSVRSRRSGREQIGGSLMDVEKTTLPEITLVYSGSKKRKVTGFPKLVELLANRFERVRAE